MRRVLLDTHAFLWFVFGDARLSAGADAVLSDPATEKLVSVASLWEITIKTQLGKLELGMPLRDFFRSCVEERELQLIGIRLPDLVAYARLPLHHRDPFDRLLVAQALSLESPLVTSDARFQPYGVPLLW